MKPSLLLFRFLRNKAVNIICGIFLTALVIVCNIYSYSRRDLTWITRDEWVIISADNVVGWVCLILFFTLIFNVKHANESMLLFHVMVYLTGIGSCIDNICFAVDHDSSLVFVNYIANSISFIMLIVLSMTYWWCLMAELGFDTKAKKIFSKVLVGIVAADFIMIIASNFTGLYFSVGGDDNGSYVTGPLYFLSLIPIFVILTGSIVATVRTKKLNVLDRIVVVLFPVAPLICALTQAFKFYGISLYLTILIAQLLIYGFFYTKRGEELEEDFLTGANSATSYHKLIEEVNKKINSGTIRSFAIVECDLNNLKRINDNYGHEEGNIYLKNCYAAIKDYFKSSRIYRVGGDEFVIYCTGDDCENVELILSLIHTEMSARATPVLTKEVFFAAGCSTYEHGKDKTLQDVFVRADEAMYKNKVLLKGLLEQR